MTEDQATSHAHILLILEETSQELLILKKSEGNLLRKANKGVNTQSLSFGPTPPQTKRHWILLDRHCTKPKLAEPYQLSKEESLPTKLIISEALSQDKASMRFSNSWTRSMLQSTKLSKGTHISKKVYKKEEAMKSSSISKSKPLIP